MANKCTLDIELDSSVKNNRFFNKISKVSLEKMDIFKYGILNEAVPKKITERDFEYLESKIPFLYGLYEDFIELDKQRIVNLSEEENSKRISETIGVGVGLLYATQLLDVNPNIIKRIAPSEKGKYLDFKIRKNNREYEFETKGTINHSKKSTLLKDIAEKKKNSKTKATKCGIITLANKERNKKPSKLVVSDDWDENTENIEIEIKDYFAYYEFYLSFMLDSTYYNRMHKKIEKNNITKNMIYTKRIPHFYSYKGRRYIGQYFDKRLILDLIAQFYHLDITMELLYKKMTDEFGKKQIFMGIDSKIISYLNAGNTEDIKYYSGEKVFEDKEERSLMLDSDGIIIVSSDGLDKQFNDNFTEIEVKARLQYVLNSIKNEPHECGAPCRSKEKEGEPCQKLTFREHCHFHRDE